MAVLNITPDSFSDGGRFDTAQAARAQALALAGQGSDILDIGGESTRPGADPVPVEVEIARTAPIIAALSGTLGIPISIDTRNAPVGRAALDAGARILNDVSALTHDPGMAALAAASHVPICLMHAQGAPKTMQHDPRYQDVLLDVYDALAARLAAALAAGIARDNILLDPGIGFGKTADHNVTLLRSLSLFHALGCPVLLGASRKRFIGAIGDAPDPQDRMPGSIAVALHGISQGVQVLRVHDIRETRQALRLHGALTGVGTT
jgi:dihydropteroate synthase